MLLKKNEFMENRNIWLFILCSIVKPYVKLCITCPSVRREMIYKIIDISTLRIIIKKAYINEKYFSRLL